MGEFVTESELAERQRQQDQGKVELLRYLVGVAQKTDGAEVWRALFAELLSSLKAK